MSRADVGWDPKICSTTPPEPPIPSSIKFPPWGGIEITDQDMIPDQLAGDAWNHGYSVWINVPRSSEPCADLW
jgi:hypothetical protein